MNQDQSPWRSALNIGLIGAIDAGVASLIGMVEVFNKRDIVYKMMTMGNILLLFSTVFISYLAAKKAGREQAATAIGTAVITAVITAAGIALLVAIGKLINLREVFINASPVLYQILTFYYGPKLGIPLMLLSRGSERFICRPTVSGPDAGPQSADHGTQQCSRCRCAAGHAAPGDLPLGPAGQDQLSSVRRQWIDRHRGRGSVCVDGGHRLFLGPQRWHAVKTRVDGLPAGQQRGLKLGRRSVSGVYSPDFAANTGSVSQRGPDHCRPLRAARVGPEYRGRLCRSAGPRLCGLFRRGLLRGGYSDIPGTRILQSRILERPAFRDRRRYSLRCAARCAGAQDARRLPGHCHSGIW